MSINIFGISDKLKALRDRRPVLGEIVKQSIDQTLHVLMNIASVCAIAALSYWLSPFDGTVEVSRVVGSITAGISVTVVWNVIREYSQWPSSRWWDPYLDWLFEIGGVALGAYLAQKYLWLLILFLDKA